MAECHRCARELAVYQRISEALAARATIDEAVLDRLRDFAESLAEREQSLVERESREPGAEAAPPEPVPGTETVPPEPVPTETVPTETIPGTAETIPAETVPGTAPGADREADQGAVHKAGG
ncbi:serine_threonine protein kinase [Streptomyces malaysiensis subsp. malaysiensis]|nr:serine_threonine protein kinase [Streptomyces malaysiensis]